MENKINIYRLGIIILMILLFVHMFNVNLYADDYNKINSVKRIGIYFEDITELIKETSKAIYQGWSGRIISQNLVPLILITQNNIVYQILNPIIIFIFCYLLSKIINMDNKYSLEKILFFVLIIVM